MAKKLQHIEEGLYKADAFGGVIIADGEPLNLDPPRKESSTPREKDESGAERIAYWGEENDFPQRVIEDAELSTEIPALLDFKSTLLQGRRVLPFIETYNDKKQDFEYSYVMDDEIKEFLEHITFKRYWREASNDFFWFWNVFPELLKNSNGSKIVQIVNQDASYCRYEKMNKSTGKVDNLYINANWPDAKWDDPETIRRTVADPYQFDVAEQMRKDRSDSFIYPISYPSPGKNYYQLAPWNGYRTSGWYKVAQSVPRSKARMVAYLLSAKYILHIPFGYWESLYKDWHKMTPEQRKAKKLEKVKEINEKLTGAENAGKTILAEFGQDINGHEIPTIKIEAIKGPELTPSQLEDSREASEHLMRSMSVDPTLVGDGPGKKMGSGSGSDKRVAMNAAIARMQPYRDVILEPLNFIAEYNGWKKSHPGLVFKVIDIRLETLDKNHQTTNENTD